MGRVTHIDVKELKMLRASAEYWKGSAMEASKRVIRLENRIDNAAQKIEDELQVSGGCVEGFFHDLLVILRGGGHEREKVL